MYYLYDVDRTSIPVRYVRRDQVRLVGCNNGQIPKLIRKTNPLRDGDMWHIDVAHELATESAALIVDLKPNNPNKAANRSLYEVRDVWGISSSEWTRMMLRLRGLVVDGEPAIDDSANFAVDYSVDHDSIFTFLYVDGGLDMAGNIVGTWNFPRPSSTNSVLLWSADFDRFTAAAAKAREV